MARFPLASWHPTPKQGYRTDNAHLKQGVIIHSAEGFHGGMMAIINGELKKSWHFSIFKNGDVLQHVDTENISWTAGGYEANRRFWNIECEGVAGEPLTEAQYQALLRVIEWLWEEHRMGPPDRKVNFREHNEMTVYGSRPTACPSGRIPWNRLITEVNARRAAIKVRDDRAEVRGNQTWWVQHLEGGLIGWDGQPIPAGWYSILLTAPGVRTRLQQYIDVNEEKP